MLGLLKKIVGSSQERTVKRLRRMVAKVNQFDEQFKALTDEEIKAKTGEFKKRLVDGEPIDSLLPEAYGVVKAACRRMCGTDVHVSGYDQKWDMVPYDVQVLGGIAMHFGFIAEMQTGEGKTLTATMPLYLNALTGKPVHLVTVNDYLARRDCDWVGSILRWLGLSTAVLTNTTQMHERAAVYSADVVYGTAAEFGFDYLRDNSMATTKEEQVQRGHYFSIIDEIDSILIDEARTPLIISGPVPQSMQMYDLMKESAALLVKMQHDLCNKIAQKAKRDLGNYLEDDTLPQSKEEMKVIREACRRLWIVSRGMPNHKVLRRAKEHPDLRAEIDKWDLYYVSDQNKEEKAEAMQELLMMVEEKSNDFELTDKGITAWAEISGGSVEDFVMLDLGHEYAQVEQVATSEEEKMEKKLALNAEDAKRKERAHNLRQLLRAHLLMENDIDYIVQEGKIVIIDENTGRPQPGRRFSDGLHQAIEAKEGVKIQKETQTYASITLQNYFRMYDKLAGMTGTAITEAGEFKEIYKLEVLQIPTYKKCVRKEGNDEIYMTEREKYAAILNNVKENHEKGRPILLGTESVEVSEKLSRILRQNKIEHTVLNAKNHAREAEIIADAGKAGAVTVATNMAGRGTDIKLQGDSAKNGGLHVIGTTRHQSRRIDRQLSGRSARLGDPGSSQFYISFEDPLMRLFASPRLTGMIQRFRPPEGEPISAGILNRSIQTAQKRVEGRNYTMRKHTLEYDDVMNKQRQEVYSFRNEVLRTDNIIQEAYTLLENVCEMLTHQYFQSRGLENGWNPEGFCQAMMGYFPVNFSSEEFDDDHMAQEEILERATSKVIAAFDKLFEQQSQEHPERAKAAVRGVILQKIDELWQEHLLVMDHLRTEVSLRAVAQRDPLLEFKHEAFRLFHDLTNRLHTDTARNLFKIEVMPAGAGLFQDMLNQINLETNRMIFDGLQEESLEEEKPIEKISIPISAAPKVGRNDLCPCSSGKKYKRCCGLTEEPAT
ncbi:MAG: preprotein translocase subunit SecA [Chlamydiales bacterium]|nr:preprotein translocase subunit SecA [Chlamydiales bacterium]